MFTYKWAYVHKQSEEFLRNNPRVLRLVHKADYHLYCCAEPIKISCTDLNHCDKGRLPEIKELSLIRCISIGTKLSHIIRGVHILQHLIGI